MTLEIAPLVLSLIANGGYEGEECKAVNTCEVREIKTKNGPVLIIRGKIDRDEGYGYTGLRNSFKNDYNSGVNPYLYATGRPIIPVTEGLIDTTVQRIDWDNSDAKNPNSFRVCHDFYQFLVGKFFKGGGGKIIKPDTVSYPVYVPGDTIKTPVYVPGDSIPYPIYVPDTVLTDTTTKDTTAKIIKPKTELGLFRLDKIQGSKIGYGTFHRNQHGSNFYGLGPNLDLRIGGKELKGKLDLELIALQYDNDDQKLLAKGGFGFYNRHVGGGINVIHDINENTFIYPNFTGAVDLGPVVVSGKGGVGFDQEFNLRQFLEGALDYASANDNFRLQLYAKNGTDPLKEDDQYYNTAGINLAFGDKAKLLLGLEGKTNYGSNIWPNKTAEEVAKSIELKYSVGGEFRPSGNIGFFVLGYAKGQHNDQEDTYKHVEFGGKTGIKIYIPGPKRKPEKKYNVHNVSIYEETEEPIIEEPVSEEPMIEESK